MNKRPWWLLPPGRVHPAWWMAIGTVMLVVEYLGGPSAHFPVIYALPVCLAGWYSGRWTAGAMGLAFPLVRLVFIALPLSTPEDLNLLLVATFFRGVIVIFVGLWFARLAELERDLDRQVKVLEGLLPICAFCKNIRNESGQWERLEAFISKRSEAEFSHGVCPSCGNKHYPGVLDDAS